MQMRVGICHSSECRLLFARGALECHSPVSVKVHIGNTFLVHNKKQLLAAARGVLL